MIKFLPLLADADQYPPPKLSMLPHKQYFSFSQNSKEYSAFTGNKVSYMQGRYALAEALKLSGVNSQTAVLMPSYHCRSMIESALYLKGDVLFYPQNNKLEPVIDSIKILIENSSKPIKAIVIPHYFGFPQKMTLLLDFFWEKKVSIIEDCAHTYYGNLDGHKIGTFGDYAIASPGKFFPTGEGGSLICNRSNSIAKVKVESQGLISNTKGFVKLIYSLVRRDKPPNLDLCVLPKIEENFNQIEVKNTNSNNEFVYFDVNSCLKSGLYSSYIIEKFSNHKIIMSRRRENYFHWLRLSKAIKNCSVLFDESDVDEKVVPYAFPLLIESNASNIFHNLKLAGIPIWRWEDIAISDCNVTKRYRMSLLQLPCHQDINLSQIEWMIGQIKLVMESCCFSSTLST